MKETQKGQSLIEVVVAMAIFIMILLGLLSAVTVALSGTLTARDKSLANKYVLGGIEAVRNIRDRSWTELLNKSATGTGQDNGLALDGDGLWIFQGGSDVPATGFTRVVNLKNMSGADDEIQVRVTVTWRKGAQTLSSSSGTTLTKWKP